LSFLGRAKKFLRDLGTEPLAKVQYFNVACASGHRVRGERTEGYQALRCPACGEGVFVLPRSPLPDPTPPGRPAGSKAAGLRSGRPFVEEGPVELMDPTHAGVELADRRTGRVEADIIWEDELPERGDRRGSAAAVAGEDPADAAVIPAPTGDAQAPVARAPERRAPRQDRRGPTERPPGGAPASKSNRSKANPPTEPPSPGGAAPSRKPAAGSRRASRPTAPVLLEVKTELRRGSRVGLMVVLVTLLVVAAVSWRYWRQRLDEFPLIAERAREQGIPALDAGDFDKAHQLLAAGRKAVDALDGAVGGAEEIREAAAEAAVYVNLCDTSLEDMLAEARRTTDPDAWKSKFDMVYKGRAYVFDATITATPKDGASGAYEIDYLVCPPGETSQFGGSGVSRPDSFAQIDLSGFELFESLARPSLGDSVKFGAELAAFRFDGDRNQWVVQLAPKSGVFLMHPKALEALGKPETAVIDPPKEGEGQP
jgi:hypothetical protein